MNINRFFSITGLLFATGVFSVAVWAQENAQTAQAGAAQSNQALQQLQLMTSQSNGTSMPPVSTSQGSMSNTPSANSNNSNSNNAADNAAILSSLASGQQANNAPPQPTSASDAAFNMVTSRLFPLSSEQVVKLHELYNEAQLAQVTSPTTPPRPTATSQIVNLATGSTPPVIRLAQGFVSSLVFLDSTGAPWPIISYDVGDPRSFNIAWDKTGNTLLIQPSKLYTYGNLAIQLQGLNTPVMLTLIPGQKAVDYRVDLRIQGYGPNALPTQTQSLPPSANSVLLTVLDGVPPPGGKLLNVTGGPAEAWVKEDRLYVRTRLKILSPGWIAVMSSADGMNAYEMQETPVLLVSWRGKVLQLRVEGL